MSSSVIKGSMAWKSVSATGSNSLTIPSDANEVILDIASSNRNVCYSIPLTKAQLGQRSQINAGYGYNNKNNVIGGTVDNYVVQLTIFQNDGQNMLSGATITAYYR